MDNFELLESFIRERRMQTCEKTDSERFWLLYEFESWIHDARHMAKEHFQSEIEEAAKNGDVDMKYVYNPWGE